jgi:multicomponent Na+:H+ antiporter subunit B
MKNAFRRWLDGDIDLMEGISDAVREHDSARADIKERDRKIAREIDSRRETALMIARERKGLKIVYGVISVICCVLVILVFMYIIAQLPLYGVENVRATTVAQRYIEHGLEETGAINIVSGMILDYRAFDTLGESHVLFTALICVMILLRVDSKNQRQGFEDYYATMRETYFASEKDTILKTIGIFLVPCIFIYGIYVLLNGQNSPGGGFSGGAIMGAAMIIFTSAFGFDRVDRFFTLKLQTYVTFVALSFYSFAKGYVFFTGANGLENHIPKGTPGAILSGGLILPLDVAVGLVVACTMFGFYSLFRRGQIGGTPGRLIS